MKILVIFLSLIPCICQAGIGEELQKTFEQMNSSVNVSTGGAYKGQEGGYYTGGSLYVRNPSRTVNPVNFQLPSVEGDCHGINLYTGAFSFINSSKLVETLKSIGANASSYAFSLALKQMSPQIMNQIEEIGAKLNWANELSINSCNAGKLLVNNGASLLEESNVGTCIRKVQGENTDYFKAKTECQAQAKVNAKNKEAENKNEPTISNLNIVWEAIEKNDLLKTLDKEFKFLLMSLTGTIVFRTEGNQPTAPYFYHSKLHSNEIISGLARGKPFQGYVCQDKKCLIVLEKELKISADKSFVGQIYRLLQGIEEKIIEDERPLTDKERGFLELTTLPVYKMLNVQSAFYQGMAFLNTESYAEIIALDVLHSTLDNNLHEILSTNKNGLIPEHYQRQYQKMLEQARRRVMELRMLQAQKTGTVNDMVAKVQWMEKQTAALVSSQLFTRY